MEQESILSVHELKVVLDGNEILKDLSFFVKKGDVLALVGPNGAGKSVLFRALLGLICPPEISYRQRPPLDR